MLLSICIPTKDRIDVLRETLNSIKSQNVDRNCFEVIISDNSEDNLTELMVDEFKQEGINIKYYKNPEKGFLNSVFCLKKGNGDFLKLHNNYSSFRPGALAQLIDVIKKNEADKTQLLFTNGQLKCNSINYFGSFDLFIKGSSYWNTWSSGFSIWKVQLDALPIVDVSKNFPHTSLLFMNNKLERYGVDDNVYFDDLPVAGKGGYNIFELFCVEYVEMLVKLESQGSVSNKTMRSVINDMSNRFIPQWLCLTILMSNNFTFDSTNYKEHIKKYFGGLSYLKINIIAYIRVIYQKTKNLLQTKQSS